MKIPKPSPAPAPIISDLAKLEKGLGEKLLMIGGVLFIACLFGFHVLGIGKNPSGISDDADHAAGN